MNVDLPKALGRKHYSILKRLFMEEPDQNLTMNEILDLIRKILSIDSFGLTGWVDTANGARIEVVLGDESAVFEEIKLDNPAPIEKMHKANARLRRLVIEYNVE